VATTPPPAATQPATVATTPQPAATQPATVATTPQPAIDQLTAQSIGQITAQSIGQVTPQSTNVQVTPQPISPQATPVLAKNEVKTKDNEIFEPNWWQTGTMGGSGGEWNPDWDTDKAGRPVNAQLIPKTFVRKNEPFLIVSKELYDPKVRTLKDLITAPDLFIEHPEMKNLKIRYASLDNNKVAEIINPNNIISSEVEGKIFDNLQSSLAERPKSPIPVYSSENEKNNEVKSSGLGPEQEPSKPIPLGNNQYVPSQTPISRYVDSSTRIQTREPKELEPLYAQDASSEKERKTPFRVREVDIPGLDFEKYKMVVGDIESGNFYGQENKLGFLGRYQMGAEALFDAGYVTVKNNKSLNDPKNWNGPYALRNNIKSKQDFLNSPAAQDDAFANFTNSNYKTFKKAGLMGEKLESRDIIELATGGFGSKNALNYWKYQTDLQGETLRNNPGGIRGYAEKFSERWFGKKEMAMPTERPASSIGAIIESAANIAADVLDSFADLLTGGPAKGATQRRTNNPNEPLTSLYEPALVPGDVSTRARPNEAPLKSTRGVYPEYVTDRNANQIGATPKFNMDSIKPLSEGIKEFGDMIVNVFGQGMQQAQPMVNEAISSVDMDSLKDVFNSSMMRYTYSYF
jgi:hypothetical protein